MKPSHPLVMLSTFVAIACAAPVGEDDAFGFDEGLVIGQTVVGASDDAHVQGGASGGKNFGTDAELRVKDSSSADFDRQAFLRFDLTELQGRQVVSATLVLDVSRVGSDVDARGVPLRLSVVPTTSWSERTLTFTNKPAIGTSISTFTVVGPRALSFDVSALVAKTAQTGGTAVSVAIAGTQDVSGARDIYYASNEFADAAKRPRLYVELGASEPPQSTGASAFLISKAELLQIKAWADQGTAPHASNRTALVTEANRSWSWGSVSGSFVTTTDATGDKRCHPSSASSATSYLTEGASHAYAKILAHHLTGQTAFASDARARLMDLVDTSGFSGLAGNDYSASNQCVLELAESIANWIVVAQLLEGTAAWSTADATAFKSWLASQVYPKVAWASRVRKNNWGAAGSLAASLIARYVDGSVASLREVSPAAITLTPAQSAAAHEKIQIDRMGTTWRGDSSCSSFGIQSHGGIPDELRRGSTGCGGDHLIAMDSSHAYQTMHVELLVYHAEALRRCGVTSLFDHLQSTKPSLLSAIHFVIANQRGSWDWGTRRGVLYVADRYFQDSAARAQAPSGSFRGGRIISYARLTHYLQ